MKSMHNGKHGPSHILKQLAQTSLWSAWTRIWAHVLNVGPYTNIKPVRPALMSFKTTLTKSTSSAVIGHTTSTAESTEISFWQGIWIICHDGGYCRFSWLAETAATSCPSRAWVIPSTSSWYGAERKRTDPWQFWESKKEKKKVRGFQLVLNSMKHMDPQIRFNTSREPMKPTWIDLMQGSDKEGTRFKIVLSAPGSTIPPTPAPSHSRACCLLIALFYKR